MGIQKKNPQEEPEQEADSPDDTADQTEILEQDRGCSRNRAGGRDQNQETVRKTFLHRKARTVQRQTTGSDR